MWRQELRWMRHVVHAKHQELRLDRWLRGQFPSLPQSFLQTQLRKRKIRLQSPLSDASGQATQTRASSLLAEGSVVAIDAHLFRSKLQPILVKEQQAKKRKETLATAEHKMRVRDLRQRVLYEDEQFVVLNKPHGLAVQSGSTLTEPLDWYLPSVAESLASGHCHSQPSEREQETLKLVHRLDKETSGVLVVARSRLAAAKFSELLRSGAVHKTYEALVAPLSSVGDSYSRLKKLEGRILNLPVDRKTACTLVERVLRRSDRTEPMGTWLQLQPRTGRKHQLRVHCAQELGAPIVGDVKYGGCQANRLYLHASRIQFSDPFCAGISIDVSCKMTSVDSWADARRIRLQTVSQGRSRRSERILGSKS